MVSSVLKNYDFYDENAIVKPFGTGLINFTWIVNSKSKKYILQRINENVFPDPQLIDENIKAIAAYFAANSPGYLFPVPLFSIDNKTLVNENGDGLFRIFEFVEGSHSYAAVNDPQLAYEAAKQFGKFTKLLAGFDQTKLETTLPHFHNLSLRYRQFEVALENAETERILDSSELIFKLKANKNIVLEYEQILQNPVFKIRVTHHDTKISNVLFNESNKGICVIDLDTVMPGYFISDIGDMMRTYLCAASEEEKDLNKISIRNDYFKAIVQGYLGEMKSELSSLEINAFVYAGKFMIYMQALRFLTDFLNNDIYYGAKYPEHNLIRAANQLALLDELIRKETVLNEIVENFVSGTNIFYS